MELRHYLDKIIDNRGKNPQYYEKEAYPVIDNVYIKNNYYIDTKSVNRYINEDTYNKFLRGYVEKDMPLMTLVGNGIGNVGLAESNQVAIVQNTIGFKTNEKLLPKYLYYWFLTKQSELKDLDRGTGQPSINKTDIEILHIDVPNLEKQQKVVKILSTLDDKIKENITTNNNLQEISSNLYNEYFIANNNIEFSEKKLGEIAKEIITGKTPLTSKEEYWGGNIPFVTIPDMHNDVFIINAERYLTEKGNHSQIKKLLPPNSIMVSCIATVGLVSINSSPSHTNQQINSIIIKNDYDLYFLYENMKTRVKELKGIGASGTSTLNVNKGEFEKLIIKYPTKKLLLNFDKNVKPLFKKIQELQKENETLKQLRDTLLPKLMNGEIDLENIEI